MSNFPAAETNTEFLNMAPFLKENSQLFGSKLITLDHLYSERSSWLFWQRGRKRDCRHWLTFLAHKASGLYSVCSIHVASYIHCGRQETHLMTQGGGEGLTNGSTGHAVLYTSKKADITLNDSPEAKLCNDEIPPQVFSSFFAFENFISTLLCLQKYTHKG